MPTTRDIWVYAAEKVSNKGVMARIGHSARFHGLRSAINSKGSFASKALGGLTAIGRASLSLIPIPVIGGLISQAETAIEGKLRSYMHTRKLNRGGPITVEEHVKFSLKEASVADMDRYRFKVSHSVDEMKAAGDAWNATGRVGTENGTARCAGKLDLALKVAQAERRLDIFDTKVAELQALLSACSTWSQQCRSSVTDYKNQVREHFLESARAEDYLANSAATPAAKTQVAAIIMSHHKDCGDFCVHHDNKTNTTWDRVRSVGADVVRELQAPFSAESFLSLNRASFESANQVDNYKPKDQRSS
ncbi:MULTISPECIES: hypothetical protein [Cupriavidus]|uniref:Uncharacterized protein n=1 Tax=Cupriavidus pinatubonensis (strain JMP 134 / LMG 1197) TaxID=264198 RepID=Q470V5_CUPPJ|nr:MULTISPECIES: hypothetical protein [Cupriavidus]QYY33247.1 hypothetical protein K2O51_21305 [Cupriavidus pinatubonensis]TPQ36863.1 hypothetical protein C2U69_17635 [Cupriavidus pinatubonensis]